MEQKEHPELAQLKKIERELVETTQQWAEEKPGPKKAQLAARIALLKRQYVSQRIAAKRAGALREV